MQVSPESEQYGPVEEITEERMREILDADQAMMVAQTREQVEEMQRKLDKIGFTRLVP